MIFGERRGLERHAGLVTGDELDQRALVRLAGDEAFTSVAPLFQVGVRGEGHLAPGFGGLMATGAMTRQDRSDLAVVADRRLRLGISGKCLSDGTPGKQ